MKKNLVVAQFIGLLFMAVQICFAQQKRLAVLYFENIISPEKITSAELGLYNVDRQYDYLERAFTDMLISDLADTKDIELVERSKVEKLLDEMRLGETGLIDENTIQKAGKALQADYLIFGYIDKKKERISVEIRIQDVSTKKIIELEPISDFENKIFELEKNLYLNICSNMRLPLEKETKKIKIEKNSTLAILPFNNNSKTEELNYLQSSLSELIANDLVNYKIFKLVEREKIDAVFKELALQKTGIIDEKTAVQIGKLLGAKYILLGSFIGSGNVIRLDARLSAVETGKTPIMAYSKDVSKNLLKIHQSLINKIVSRLKE
ncbi:MAG: CsgG/HfaB family protein [Elusimicrobiota bacterium]|nr:CsgG/HfaB family protein [Elusimicrobiota bacterium]